MPIERDYFGADTSTVVLGEGVEAFLAKPKPEGHGPYPAVILGHERYGLVKHTLDLAARFASYSYVCIAPDMASLWDGDKEALNRGDARLTLTEDQIKFYMAKSLDYLQTQPYVENSRIAAMGVCQSGAYPLLLNSIRPDTRVGAGFVSKTVQEPAGNRDPLSPSSSLATFLASVVGTRQSSTPAAPLPPDEALAARLSRA